MSDNKQVVEASKRHIAETAQNYDLSDFLAGQRDCRDGVPHKAGMSESYDRGYGCQYESEQVMGVVRGH